MFQATFPFISHDKGVSNCSLLGLRSLLNQHDHIVNCAIVAEMHNCSLLVYSNKCIKVEYLVTKVFQIQIVPPSASKCHRLHTPLTAKPSAASPPRNMIVGAEQPRIVFIVSRTVCSELWGLLRPRPSYQDISNLNNWGNKVCIFSVALPPRRWSAPEARRSRWRSKWESSLKAVKTPGSSKAIPSINDSADAKLWLHDHGNLVETKLGFYTRNL